MTAEELLRLPGIDRRYELLDGELIEHPFFGAQHGVVAMEIATLLAVDVGANHLSEVFATGKGFILRRNPDTVRAPDASFMARDRLPAGELPGGYMELAPDLAVEVVSPSDSVREVEDKLGDWLRAGTQQVWVIDPSSRTVRVYRSPEECTELSEGDRLEGNELIPGLSCEVSGLFA